MGRKEGAKFVSQERPETMYDMECIGVRTIDMCKHFKMPNSTYVMLYAAAEVSELQKKEVFQPCKLSTGGMRLLQKFVTEFCFEPMYYSSFQCIRKAPNK